MTEHKHYITASSGTVAIYTTRSTNVTTLRYLHKDHPGSTNAISDETGAVVERLAYDAWGKRQFPNGTTDPGNTLAGVNTDRGFTGHEHLEEVGLVHMNGRIYDRRIGRFTSADPMIQAPYNLQSYNRYSYAFNSPLNGVDLSGYGLLSFINDIFDAVGDLIGSVAKGVSSIAESKVGRMGLSIGVGYMTGNWYLANFGGWSGASVAAGALGGFSGTMVATGGDFEASVKGAIVGAGFGWAGGLDGNLIYAGHAAVGCASGELQGGGCLRGAASAVAGKLMTVNTKGWEDYERFAMTVAVGGTVSVIGGGQFANGAMSAAMGYLYNKCSHEGCWTTSKEKGFLNQGDYLSYYGEACGQGDSYACKAYSVAAEEGVWGKVAQGNLHFRAALSGVELTSGVKDGIRLDLARSYAALLPNNASHAVFPTAEGITKFHWEVFDRYGLPSSAFTATPTGNTSYFGKAVNRIIGPIGQTWGPAWCTGTCK